jgi:DNA-binding NarL/FixJ family response regulator
MRVVKALHGFKTQCYNSFKINIVHCISRFWKYLFYLFIISDGHLFMVRMLIADDHPIIRQRLKQLLLEEFPSAFFAEAQDTVSLLNEAMAGEWDIIISDLAMPGGGGLHALTKIKETKPQIPVLIISTYPEEQYASRVIQAGAIAFLSKDNAESTLASIVKQILNKE